MNDQEDPKPQYRFDPFMKEWVIYAPQRGNRPFQGKSFEKEEKEKKTWTCPFCPDAPEGAGVWTVKQLPNRFAALNEDAPPFIEESVGDFFKKASNYGKCEVILYSQDHDQSFGNLEHSNIVALIELWVERFHKISELDGIKYVYIMENRGKEIGNSMTHPHGQIYSFPFVPIKIDRIFKSVIEHHENTGKCLWCQIIEEELKHKKRIIEETEYFFAEIPYYAHWSYEIQIFPKRHVSTIAQLTSEERNDLAIIMKNIVQRYDILRGDGNLMPYVMGMHNGPVNVKDQDKWHFHIEFYTPFRGKDRWKFLAGVELGTNTFISDSLPEINAKILRDIKLTK